MDPYAKIEDVFRLTRDQRDALARLSIHTVEDLLYHFPTRYGDSAEARAISSLAKGETAVIYGEITHLKASKGWRSKIPMAEGTITDASGLSIKAVWFNQPYIAKMTREKSLVRAEGKVAERKGTLYLSNPKLEHISAVPAGAGESLFGKEGESHILYPVYPESRGISSNWIYHTIQKIFRAGVHEALADSIPEIILKKYNLPSLSSALIWIHTPQKQGDAIAARKRFSFEEVFYIQLEKQRERRAWKSGSSYLIDPDPEKVKEFVARFPFTLSRAQQRAIDSILSDMQSGEPMSRLLEGDVGSGKTAVAATTVYAVATTRPKGRTSGSLQIAYMCPTEILATQHFESFIQYFRHLPIQVGLITGRGCRKFPSKVNPSGWTDISRAQLKKWVANGEIPILIGTHALIEKSVVFKDLAYTVIDEQHRFGTTQRQKLVTKHRSTPHLLSMTATPIPRTLALTAFGDLDLSLLDEMPAGRKPIVTTIVMPDTRDNMYKEVQRELEAGRQAYVICPRIDEPDPTKELAVQAKSVKEEAKRLKKHVFQKYEIGILHSKMKDDEKERVMQAFQDGTIHILVATSVVEVGVNVPNATVIVIEGAERFGLAQLHQLRGRVIRSNHQAYCFVYAETAGEKTRERLSALTTAKNGFELAEFDLKFRGTGDLSGKRQWGISDIGMEAIQNLRMVEAARTEVTQTLSEDPDLIASPLMRAELTRRNAQKIHFE